MTQKKEFIYKFNDTQFNLPYHKCDKNEKKIRRFIAIRLKIREEERFSMGKPKIFSDIIIYKYIANVPRSNFYRWYRQEKNDHGSGISGYKRGPKQKYYKYLTNEQIEKMKKDIVTKYPHDFNISRCLWDRKAVAEYCKITFNVKYSLHTISKILRHNGFVLRHPAKFSVKRNQEAIDTFKTETYHKIVNETLEDKGIILFLDETAVQQNSNTCRGFSPVGVAPHLEHYTQTSAHRVGSLFICISSNGFMFHQFEEKTCKTNDFLWFLDQLSKKIRCKKIHIVLDNAKIHRAIAVQKYLKKHFKFKLHFLPPYAPDINPVELFNNALKSKIRHSKAMDSAELIEFIDDYMNEKKYDKEFIKNFFNGKEVKYTKSA